MLALWLGMPEDREMRTETENSCRNSPGLTHVQRPTHASTVGSGTPHTRQHAGNCWPNCSPGEAGLRDGIWLLGLYGWEYRPQSHSRHPIQGRSAEPRPAPPAWCLQPPGSQVPCARPAALPYAPKPLAHHQGQTDPATPRFPPLTTPETCSPGPAFAASGHRPAPNVHPSSPSVSLSLRAHTALIPERGPGPASWERLNFRQPTGP